MRLKESVFTGPDTYTFKVQVEDRPLSTLTIVVDESRYFQIDKFPHDIPISVYAEYVSGHVSE